MGRVTAATGIHKATAQKYMRRERIAARPARVIDLPDGLADSYKAGESVSALARRYRVSRRVVELRLQADGVPLRGRAEATRLHHARKARNN